MGEALWIGVTGGLILLNSEETTDRRQEVPVCEAIDNIDQY